MVNIVQCNNLSHRGIVFIVLLHPFVGMVAVYEYKVEWGVFQDFCLNLGRVGISKYQGYVKSLVS